MKDETKNKLKHFGKAMAYVMGICIALCAGLVLGKCSSDSAHKIQTSVRAEYSPDVHNYLDDSVRMDAGISNVSDLAITADGTGALASFPTYFVDLRSIPYGYYCLDTSDRGEDYTGGVLLYCQRNVYDVFLTASELQITGSFTQSSPNTDFSVVRADVSTYTDNYFFSNDSSLSFRYLAVNCRFNLFPKLYLVNFVEVPSSDIVTFSKQNWFPYQLLGSNNAPVVRGPTWSNLGDQQNIELNNIVFRSNNTIFTSIIFRFAPLGIYGSEASAMNYPTTYGYYTSDMEQIWVEKVNSHDLWYLSQVDYISYDNLQYVVGHQRRKLYDDGSVGAVTQYFDWVSSAYSTIEMIEWSDSINNNVSTGLMSSYDWIKAIASSVTVTPDVFLEGANPFTLLADAFHTFDSILGIHILPMISLGTLIFTPLVLVVIMAIIKILNK